MSKCAQIREKKFIYGRNMHRIRFYSDVQYGSRSNFCSTPKGCQHSIYTTPTFYSFYFILNYENYSCLDTSSVIDTYKK